MQDERADLVVVLQMSSARTNFIHTNSYSADRESARIWNSWQLALALVQNHTVVLSKKAKNQNPEKLVTVEGRDSGFGSNLSNWK